MILGKHCLRVLLFFGIVVCIAWHTYVVQPRTTPSTAMVLALPNLGLDWIKSRDILLCQCYLRTKPPQMHRMMLHGM